MPLATIIESQKIGRPASSGASGGSHEVGRGRHERHDVDVAAGVDHAHDHRFEVGRDARQVGLGPDGGERRA